MQILLRRGTVMPPCYLAVYTMYHHCYCRGNWSGVSWHIAALTLQMSVGWPGLFPTGLYPWEAGGCAGIGDKAQCEPTQGERGTFVCTIGCADTSLATYSFSSLVDLSAMHCNFSLPAHLSNGDSFWQLWFIKTVPHNEGFHSAKYTMTQTSGFKHPEFLYLYSTMTFVSKHIATFALYYAQKRLCYSSLM